MTPKFAVSYLRVSTRGQAERGGGADEGFSIPAQREANKRKAHSMGAIIGKTSYKMSRGKKKNYQKKFFMKSSAHLAKENGVHPVFPSGICKLSATTVFRR